MKAYVTVHGQAQSERCLLTDTGIKQADIFGEYMKELGFIGKIYSSYAEASMETARIVGEYTNSEVIPLKILAYENEEKEDTVNRLKKDIKALEISEDVLFIWDLKGADILLNVFGKPGDYRVCNCSLSTFNLLDESAKKVYGDDGHLPYKLRGYDFYMKSEEDLNKLNELLKKGFKLPEKFKNTKSTKLLHISDTPSYFYPYYERMIEEIKPDIIIHTGDFSDELKAGRVKLSIPEYNEKVPEIARILKNSGADKIYAVCGNNDVETSLKSFLPEASFISPGEIIDICGIKCSLGHAHYEVTEEAEWLFYGHGLTGEKWTPEKNNIKNGMCRFNAIWNSSLILIQEREIFSIPYPDL